MRIAEFPTSPTSTTANTYAGVIAMGKMKELTIPDYDPIPEDLEEEEPDDQPLP